MGEINHSTSHRVTGWEAAQELTDRLTAVAAQEKFTAGWISVGTPSKALSLLISKSNWRRGPPRRTEQELAWLGAASHHPGGFQ